MDRVTLSLPDLEALAESGGYSGLAMLSNISAALVLSASVWFSNPANWTGDGLELTDAEKDAIDEYCAQLEYEIMQSCVGLVLPYPGIYRPSWGLWCDGTEYTAAAYPELWEVLKDAFQASYDSFYVPDLRDRVVVGHGSDVSVGDYGGENETTLDAGQMPAHVHQSRMPMSTLIPVGELTPVSVRTTGYNWPDTTSTGDGDPVSLMQAYCSLKYVIVAGRYT